jgi:hypothetical protein
MLKYNTSSFLLLVRLLGPTSHHTCWESHYTTHRDAAFQVIDQSDWRDGPCSKPTELEVILTLSTLRARASVLVFGARQNSGKKSSTAYGAAETC